MGLNQELLDILVCPRCKGKVQYDAKKQGLDCLHCEVVYPIENDIPIMLEDEAFPLKEGGDVMTADKRKTAIFEITEGKNKGDVVKLPIGTCKAIGRSLDDLNKTEVFSLDFTMTLDDFTKKLILNYVSQKFQPEKKSVQETASDKIGGFKRLPDLILNDPAISRLHAMMFHDVQGAGILDLVSKNGTYVNGDEVESKSLQNGDLVMVGNTKMVFHMK